MTLRVYAHLVPDEETDLSFRNFGGPGRPRLLKRAPETKMPSAELTEGTWEIWRARHDSNV
jgi:hypothetical protein